jgi:hypothetical protein
MLFAVFAGAYKLKKNDMPAAIIFLYMVWSLIGEVLVVGKLLYESIQRFHVPIYYVDRIAPIVEFILCVSFYHFSNTRFRERKIGLYVVGVGIIYWVANFLVYKKAENFNVYFMPFSSFINIVLSVISIYLLQKETEFKKLVSQPVFQFTLLLLFYWGLSFFFFIAYDLILRYKYATQFASFFVARINDIFFLGVGIAYLFYPKKIHE